MKKDDKLDTEPLSRTALPIHVFDDMTAHGWKLDLITEIYLSPKAQNLSKASKPKKP